MSIIYMCFFSLATKIELRLSFLDKLKQAAFERFVLLLQHFQHVCFDTSTGLRGFHTHIDQHSNIIDTYCNWF